MIRINLLKRPAAATVPAPQDQEAALKPSGSSTFISRREVALGGLFLLLGGAILATQVFDIFEDPELVEQMTADAPPKEIAVQMPAPALDPDPGFEPAASPTEEQPPAAPAAGSTGPPDDESIPSAEAPEGPIATPTEPKPSPQRKQPVRPEPTVASASPTPTAFVAPEDAVPVSDVRVVPWGDSREVVIAVAGAQYNTFRLENPPRFVVDIQNAALRMPSTKRNIAVDHPAVQRIRSAQNSFDPALVRVVIETAVSAPEVSATADGISIKLGPQR